MDTYISSVARCLSVIANEFENCRGHPHKILVTWDMSVHWVIQEVASFLFSLKDP